MFDLPQFQIMHGGLRAERKAGELRELSRAIREWGIEPLLVEAAAKRLDKIAGFNLKERFKSEMPAGGYQEMIKAIEEISKKSGWKIE